VAVEKFLKQRAVSIAVDGHYSLPNWYDPEGKPRTFACRTKRVSPFRMMVDVPVTGKVGDHLTSYFRDFGPLDGRISDIRPGCFLLELDMTFFMREKLANKLGWLEEKLRDPGIPELRKEARIIPHHPYSSLTLADGSIHDCRIIDMSVTGAAVSCQVQMTIGTPLAIGACVGRVVRALPNGFAVRFVEPPSRHALDRLIVRPAMPTAGNAKAARSDSLVEA
jgi:PilZ domain